VGIRQLDGNRDLHAYFLPTASEESKPSDRPSTKAAAPPKRKISRRLEVVTATDRHGIPRLDDQTDLRQFFETALEDDEDTPANAGLGEVFRTSLNHDTRRLMKKKTGGFFAPRRLSLKEKLRRYPAPQAQLDLHGDTALIARQRTDSFLRTAVAAGTLTVRIIVGKGLHSEDGAVLPDVIEDLLVALKRDGRVLTFRWDKDRKRKSGAVIVYLEPLF
jgi:DNA-nicking Smr family endonuclease